MGFVLMTDPGTGNVAIFEENGTTGAVTNPNSVRNAPLNSPTAHLSKVRFHSSFDYYLVHSGPTSVGVTHQAVPAATNVVPASNGFAAVLRYGQVISSDILLVSHGLSYVPAYMVISDGTLIGPSTIIQTSAGGRLVTPYATTTGIYLRDSGASTDVTLAAMSKTYQVVVFRAPVADRTDLIDAPVGGPIALGRGKFRSTDRALRVRAAGDSSPFDISLGRTVDIRGGYGRTVLADGSTFSMAGYTGSFSGSPSIEGSVE